MISALGLALGLGSSACGSKDSSNSNSNEVRCIETPQEYTSLAQPTPMGVTPQQILDFAVGARTDALHWRGIALGREMTFGMAPESGVTQITTEIIPTNAPARWILSVPENPLGNNLDITDCPDRLEFDVQLRVESQNGALRELVPVKLVATSPHAASVRYVSSKAQPPQGSLALVQSNPPGAALSNLSYNLSYSPIAHYGELRGLAQIGEKYAQVELATWPNKAPTPTPRLIHNCLSPLEQFYMPIGESLLGFSARALSQRISSSNPVLVNPMMGETMPGEVSFSVTQDRACVSSMFELPQPDLRTQFGTSGLLELRMGDRIVRLPSVAVSTTNGREVVGSTIKSEWTAKRPLVGALEGAAFRATYGDFGLDLQTHPYYAIYGEARYQTPMIGSTEKPLRGGVQVMGVTPTPRSPSGAVVEVLGRWEFRG